MRGYLAFIYDDHYCNGISNSLAGLYNSNTEAQETLKGGRWDKQNLEIMHLETLGISRYRWKPLYEHHGSQGSKNETLTHSWDKTKPAIQLEWDQHVRRYGHNNPFFDAGDWEPVND